MNRYRIKVIVAKTYTAEEELTLDIDATDEEDAREKAIEAADIENTLSAYDGELEETDYNIVRCEFLEGILPEGEPTPRCTETADMFGGNEA